VASTEPQRSLADYGEWWQLGEPRPCYAQAGFVLVRPSGQTLRFSCAEHLPAWENQIQGHYIRARAGRMGSAGLRLLRADAGR
jgi:hypothetical protein